MNPICLNTKEPSVRRSLMDIYNLSEFSSDEVFEEYGIKYNTVIQQVTDRLERLGYISKEQAADIVTLNTDFDSLSEDVQDAIRKDVTKHYFTFNNGKTIQTPFELNSQQRDALNEINDFVNSRESTMTLAGYAGTGKTSLMEIVAKGIKGNFVFTATTHAAAGVLKSRVEKLGYNAYTVHKAFGINVETDKKQTVYDAKNLVTKLVESKILRPGYVVIIDEASMINENQYEVLSNLAEELNLKIIFVGDRAQLAPVRETQISKVFRNNNGRIVELTQVERTGDNAILKEATALRDGEELSNESEFNAEGKGVAYIKPSNKQSIRDIIQKFTPKLKENSNYFRILAYRNAKVAAYNQAVRNTLGYTDSIPRVGEPMMGYKNYGYNHGTYDLINSGSYAVEFVGKPVIRKYNLDGEVLEFESIPIILKNSLGETHTFNYTDIKDNAQNRANAILLANQKDKLWEIHNNSKNLRQKREIESTINYIDEFLFVNDNVTKGERTLVEKVIDFGYAMTVHKSQGSTFTNIILDEDDISAAKSERVEGTNLTVADIRKQLEYVGVSRATDTVTIISSDTKTEDTPLNHENTAQTKETTNPILEQYKKNIEHLSGYFEGGGVVLLDDFPNLPTELVDKLGDHFMGGKELTLDDYRKLWRYIKFDDKGQVIPSNIKSQFNAETKINIYAGTGENPDLSNFAKRPFEFDSPLTGTLVTYNTVEGAFQAAKLGYTNLSTEETARIDTKLMSATGAEAKRIGRSIKGLNTEKWDKDSSRIMKELIKASFEQNPKALQRLLATGNATLTHTQDKGKWGTEFPRILMEVREELKEIQPTQEIHQSSFDISDAEFYSGAAEGSDKYWGEQARALGIKVKDYTTQSYKDLNQEWKDRIEQEYTEARAFLGKPKLTGKSGELTRRDMMQADKADAIFAIAERIVKPGEKEISNGKEYTNNTNHDNVQGGTANAVARGIQRDIPVYVFDQSDNKWKVWDKNTNSFIETEMPTLTPHAATIGTRGINESGKQAIRNILNATINQLTNIESVSTETQQETTDVSDLDEGFLNEVEEAIQRKEESAKEADKVVINNYRAPMLEVTQQQIDDVNSKLSPERQEVVSRFISKVFVRLIDSKLKEAQEQINERANNTKKDNESIEEAKNRIKAEIRRENKEYLRRLGVARNPQTRDEELELELIGKIIPLEQIDVINRDSLQSLVDEIRDMMADAANTASTQDRKDLLGIAVNNFNLLFNMASTRINQVYGLNIFGDLSDLDREEDSGENSSDTGENNFQDEENSVKEDFSKNGDHSKSSELSLSKEVRLLYEDVYQTYNDGQFIKDALNQKIPVDLSSAHAAISNQLRFMIDARDMVPLLMRMSQPWVKQVLNKLVVCDDKGNPILDNGVPTIKDDNLFNAFYSSYRLYFQPMTVMYKDKKTGQYKTRNLSVTENVQYLMNTVRRNIATSTLQGTAKHSIYKDGKINKTKDTIQDVIELKDFIRELRKSFARKEYKDIDSFFAAHGLESKLKNYLQNIGFEISSDTNILDEIKSATISSRESFANYFNTLDNLLESIYNICNLTINKTENEDIDIVNNSRRDYVLVAQMLSGTVKNTVETSTNEDGKNIYSLGKPSYLSNMVQKIKQTVSDKSEGNVEYYNSWIENTFGQFDFFRNQDTKEWRSDICEKLFGDNPRYREIFDHTRLLKIDKSEYTKWTERECNLALFNMYNSIKFNKETGNEQQAWFRLFLFSDSPAGDFIKFIKYVDTEDAKYQDILIDKFWGLFNQERARMRNVKKRLDMQVNGEPLNLIAGYDATLSKDGSIDTAGGLVLRFMPGLNYLKVDESYPLDKLNSKARQRLLGRPFVEVLEILERGGNMLGLTQDDIKSFFATGFLKVFDADFEKTYKSLFDSGTVELDENGFVEGIVNSRGEQIKLHSNSSEKLKKHLSNLLKNKSLSSEDKTFLTSVLDKLDNNRYISEEELESAVDIFNSYVDTDSIIEFEHSPLWLAWREYEMNFNFMTSQTLQLCTTDLAFYGKVNCKQASKTDYDFAVTINGKNQYYKITADSTIKTLQKRFKELHAPSSKGNQFLGKYKQEYEKTVYLEDKEIKSLVYKEIEKVIKSNTSLSSKDKEDILKAFSKINVADAQAYRSITSYEKVLGQMGMLTDEMKIALQHIKENKFDRWDLGVVFQTLKPYVYTRISKDSHAKTKNGNDYKISVPTQHKNSEFALMVIYAAIGQSLSSSPVLTGLNRFMENNNIDVVQFESTTKVGLQGKLDNTDFENSDNITKTLESLCGITADNPDGNSEIVHKIPMEDWGIQTATPEHIIDKRQLIGTQIRKLIMSDMPDKAEFTLKTPNGTKVTKSKKEWIKIYNNIIHQQIFDAFSQIEERFDPTKNPQGINGAALEIQKLIHESIATSYKYDRDLIEACTWNGTSFNIPLSDRCMTEKIQEILNSIVKNRVTKQKIRGGACIQVSDYGFELSDDLHIKFKEDGSIDYIPCMMPLYSKDLFDKFIDDSGNVDIERIREEAPELLEAIGYRVPTEDMYSMAHLKIVGFTPIFNGSVIMLPSEITTIAGSDFDVDKLYLMLHDFKVVKYNMKEARKAYNKEKGITKETKEDAKAIDKLLTDIFGLNVSEISKEDADNDWVKWFNKNCEAYKLPPSEWKIIIPKYDYSKDAKEQSSAARNNGMIDMMYSVLQTPYAAKKILNPGGFDPQKRASRICNIIDNSSPERLMSITGTKSLRDAIQKIQELKVKELDALEDNLSKFDNPLSAYTATRLHQQNMTGASQVGIFANYNAFHTLLQQCNVKIAGDFVINNNEALNKDNPYKLGNIFNGRGKYISKISAGYLAASVDNGKDPLLKGLNSTPETANIIGFLSLCGYEPLEVGAFMTTPAVKQVFDIMRLQKVSFEQALLQVQNSFNNSLDALKLSKDTYDSIEKDIKNLSIDTLLLCKAYNNNEDLSDNQRAFYIITNLEALYNLESINQHSQELSRILTVSRADTQNGGAGPLNIKNIDKEIRQAQVEDKQSRNYTKDGLLNPFFKIYAFTTPNQSTFTKDFFRYGVESVRQLFGRFFMEYSSVGEAIIGIISNEFGVPEKLARRAFDDWQKYNLMDTELFGQQDDIDIPTKMKYYTTQFPKEFITWKENLPSDIAQLTFITNMELEEADDNEPYSHLKLTDLGKTSSARERVKLDWLKLYEYDADMATKLFVYGGLRGGFGFNPKSYLHLAPSQLRAKMPRYITKLNNPFGYSKFYEFWKQFCRNNWAEQSIVPRLKNNKKFNDIVAHKDGTITVTIKGYKDDWEGIKIAPSVVMNDVVKEPVLCEIISRTPMEAPDGMYTVAIYKPTTALGLGDLYREYNPNSVAVKSIFKEEDIKNATLTTDDVPTSEPSEEPKLKSAKKSTEDTLGTTTNKTTRANETKC